MELCIGGGQSHRILRFPSFFENTQDGAQFLDIFRKRLYGGECCYLWLEDTAKILQLSLTAVVGDEKPVNCRAYVPGKHGNDSRASSIFPFDKTALTQ